MDLNLALIGRGLTPLIAPVGRRIGRHLIGEEILERRKLLETALQPVLEKAAEAVSERIQCYEPAEIDQICLFLTYPGTNTIIRQIYAAKLLDNQQQSFELIRQEFFALFSGYTNIPQNEELKKAANLILDDLIEGCEEALQIAIDQGRLSAHEAKSAFRHQILRDEIAAIQKNIQLLTAPQKLDVQAILKFEENYRQQVGERHKYIIPPDFDKARKVLINQLYVCPNFITIPRKQGEQTETLKITDFLSNIYRAVLLGNPGGGKSTFSLKFAHVLATCYSERPFAGRQVTPILVVLRDYGAKKKELNCSILNYIETKANSDYQTSPPQGAFEYLLLNGHVVVIFDGLDELLDTSYRREISSDIESFCNLYPSVPVLVTSREVGYDQAPLDPEKFEVFRITDFEKNQVEEYVTKWFSFNEEPKEKGEAFVKESEFVSDLRSNPLMLALMCNLYRREGYIPRNRPEVYEKCAEMLFETWDKSRQIPVEFRFEDNIRPAIAYLAYWLYADQTLQSGVTERQLIIKLSEYLLEHRFDDRDQAERAAREFIQFCRGRAWIFTAMGTTAEGEEIYQFTHRTFLEYFTALYLFRTYDTPNELVEFLLPKIAKKEWDVVTQLAFQIKSKNSDAAGDKLLTAILYAMCEADGEQQWNLLSFAARCLEFMVPSPKVTRKITTTCIEKCVAFGLERIEKEKDPTCLYESTQPGETLYYLLNATDENCVTITNTLHNFIVEKINALSQGDELSLYLEVVCYVQGEYPQINLIDHIFTVCYNQIHELCSKKLVICRLAWEKNKVFLEDLLKWHGVNRIFRGVSFTIFVPTWWSIAEEFIALILSCPDFSHKTVWSSEKLEKLKEIGHILLSCLPPWSQEEGGDRDMFLVGHFYRNSDSFLDSLSLYRDAIFGAFTLLATTLEGIYTYNAFFREDIEAIKESPSAFFEIIKCILLARFESVEKDKVQAEMDKCSFTAEQQNFIWRWIRQEINLVEEAEDEDTVVSYNFLEPN